MINILNNLWFGFEFVIKFVIFWKISINLNQRTNSTFASYIEALYSIVYIILISNFILTELVSIYFLLWKCSFKMFILFIISNNIKI